MDGEKPCKRCGIRPRHRYPSGPASYCVECRRETDRVRARERAARFAETERKGDNRGEWETMYAASVATETETARPNAETAITIPPVNGRKPSESDGIHGVLSDMLLLVDRVRHEIGEGRSAGIEVTYHVRGADIHMAVGSTTPMAQSLGVDGEGSDV